MSTRISEVSGATPTGAATTGHGEEPQLAHPMAYFSALDLFTIGIGPSSSHTVGPMRAALAFVDHLASTGRLTDVTRISCSLYGSLGATGLGHGTPDAILAGLAGFRPETCDPQDVRDSWSKLAEGATLRLAGSHEIPICKSDVSFLPRTRLAGHPNALTLSAWGGTDVFPLLGETYFSIGGGFIRQDGDLNKAPPTAPQPMEYSSGAELLALCDIHGLDICDIASVNEENASGGRVVTAPTNGAAGIIPAIGHYYLRFVPGANLAGIRRYLLTAVAIGSLVKANASISGAEGGCQAEVGTACAMASGALCAALGGTPRQVENAAEIAMEHHLGLTCDPVGGLVQVPCIERNAIASSTAVSAARLALNGDGTHLVSFDTVIETMRQTGLDMMTKYKETSEGGLAVNVTVC